MSKETLLSGTHSSRSLMAGADACNVIAGLDIAKMSGDQLKKMLQVWWGLKMTFDVWAYSLTIPQNCFKICHPHAGCPAGSCEVERWIEVGQERKNITISNMSAYIRFLLHANLLAYPFYFATCCILRHQGRMRRTPNRPQSFVRKKQWWTNGGFHLLYSFIWISPPHMPPNVYTVDLMLRSWVP